MTKRVNFVYFYRKIMLVLETFRAAVMVLCSFASNHTSRENSHNWRVTNGRNVTCVEVVITEEDGWQTDRESGDIRKIALKAVTHFDEHFATTFLPLMHLFRTGYLSAERTKPVSGLYVSGLQDQHWVYRPTAYRNKRNVHARPR